MVRRSMPGISQRRFHTVIRGPASEALEALAPYSQEIFAKWNRDVHSLGIESQDFLGQTHLDFAQFSRDLRKMSFPVFCRKIRELGETLAECRVAPGHSAAALNQLFEICVPHVAEHQPNGADRVLGLSRLHSLVVMLIVSGYTNRGFTARGPFAKKTAVNGASSAAGGRRHNASVYVTKVYEEERRRLSRDLHDEVGHDLVLIKLYLEMIALDNNNKDSQSTRPRLKEAIALVSHSIDAVRRLVLDLGPAVFDDLGFLPAVRTYTSQFSARTRIAVTLREGYLPDNIPMSHQIALYRLLQGALSNVLKHASAKSVKVSLGCMKDSVLILVIQDDGVGFDTTSRPGSHSFGMTAMRERVEVLGGRIHIQSSPPGSMSKLHGTRIEVDIPLPGAAQ